jgi:four helix bundle protein
MTDNILLDKTKTFALDCILLYKKLQEQKEYVISTQLLRSATSIGANLREAIAGQSKKDFYAKICIAFKEAYEADYWLELLHESELVEINTTQLREQCTEIKKLL